MCAHSTVDVFRQAYVQHGDPQILLEDGVYRQAKRINAVNALIRFLETDWFL